MNRASFSSFSEQQSQPSERATVDYKRHEDKTSKTPYRPLLFPTKKADSRHQSRLNLPSSPVGCRMPDIWPKKIFRDLSRVLETCGSKEFRRKIIIDTIFPDTRQRLKGHRQGTPLSVISGQPCLLDYLQALHHHQAIVLGDSVVSVISSVQIMSEVESSSSAGCRLPVAIRCKLSHRRSVSVALLLTIFAILRSAGGFPVHISPTSRLA